MTEKTCLNCGRSSDQAPLMTLDFRGETYYLCPQCLPVMIHKPQNLVGKLPGAETLIPANHDH
jgi:hypothetical protein